MKKEANPVEVHANVIPLCRRKKSREEIPIDIMFPASKNYPPEDTAKKITEDFNRLVESHDFKEDYIYHHQKGGNFNVEFSDDNRTITKKIILQLDRLKEDSRRIKYYMDEIDID